MFTMLKILYRRLTGEGFLSGYLSFWHEAADVTVLLTAPRSMLPPVCVEPNQLSKIIDSRKGTLKLKPLSKSTGISWWIVNHSANRKLDWDVIFKQKPKIMRRRMLSPTFHAVKMMRLCTNYNKEWTKRWLFWFFFSRQFFWVNCIMVTNITLHCMLDAVTWW